MLAILLATLTMGGRGGEIPPPFLVIRSVDVYILINALLSFVIPSLSLLPMWSALTQAWFGDPEPDVSVLVPVARPDSTDKLVEGLVNDAVFDILAFVGAGERDTRALLICAAVNWTWRGYCLGRMVTYRTPRTCFTPHRISRVHVNLHCDMLRYMGCLQELTLSGGSNGVSLDGASLPLLTRLVSLDISDTRGRAELCGLSALTNLRILRVRNNPTIRWSSISNLTSLTTLSMSRSIDVVEAELFRFTCLIDLGIELPKAHYLLTPTPTEIYDVNTIQHFPQLTALRIGTGMNKIWTSVPWWALPKLRHLHCDVGGAVRIFRPKAFAGATFPLLETLVVNSHGMMDPSYFKDCPHLTSLSLSFAGDGWLYDNLPHLPALTSLRISGPLSQDHVRWIFKHTALTSLDIETVQETVFDTCNLQALETLRTLGLHNCSFGKEYSAGPFASWNSGGTWSFDKSFTSLEVLDLTHMSHYVHSDLAFLANLPALKVLVGCGTRMRVRTQRGRKYMGRACGELVYNRRDAKYAAGNDAARLSNDRDENLALIVARGVQLHYESSLPGPLSHYM